MKSFIAFIAALLLATTLTTSAKIIRNPYFEARKSSIITIEEIDRSEDATRVKFHAVFRPKWWIEFGQTESLFDPATGQTYAPIAGEGISIGEKCWMPESGDTTFTIIYPPLPKKVKSVDFAPESGWTTFGIDLTGKKKTASIVGGDPIVTPRKPLPSFFTPGKVRIHGSIKGHDPRLDISDLKAYIADIPVGESTVQLIEIDDDGNFDTEFYITTPQSAFMSINNGCFVGLYLEPDNDLQLVIDWEDILDIDRMRGLKDKMDNIKFGGSLGEINRDIYFAPKLNLSVPTYRMADDTAPLDAKEIIGQAVAAWTRDMEIYADKNHLSPDSRRILDNNILAKEAGEMLDYEMYRRDKRWEFPDSDEFKQPFPSEFYTDFLPRFLNADTSAFAAADMRVVLNRLGFCGIDATLGIKDKYSAEYEAGLSRALCDFAGVASVPLMWQMAVAAREGGGISRYARWNKDFSRQSLNQTFASTISDPYLRGRLDSLYFNVVNFQPYELPDSEAGRLMRRLVAPYAGKWLLVDFWATSCGPCRANIENMKPFRDANRNNEHFDFLFITGEDESPIEDYNLFVSKNLADDHVLRLPQNDHNHLRALFGIDGIPRYVLIDPLGRVYDPQIESYNFTQHLRQENIPFVSPENTPAHF